MANMVMIPPNDITAIPLKAAPLVHPRPSCEPRPKSAPPIIAAIIRVPLVIFGPLSNLIPARFEITPEKKAPMTTPITSKTSQSFNGPPGCSSIYDLMKGVLVECCGATSATAESTTLLTAPLAPSPRPVT